MPWTWLWRDTRHSSWGWEHEVLAREQPGPTRVGEPSAAEGGRRFWGAHKRTAGACRNRLIGAGARLTPSSGPPLPVQSTGHRWGPQKRGTPGGGAQRTSPRSAARSGRPQPRRAPAPDPLTHLPANMAAPPAGAERSLTRPPSRPALPARSLARASGTLVLIGRRSRHSLAQRPFQARLRQHVNKPPSAAPEGTAAAPHPQAAPVPHRLPAGRRRSFLPWPQRDGRGAEHSLCPTRGLPPPHCPPRGWRLSSPGLAALSSRGRAPSRGRGQVGPLRGEPP